MLHRELHQPLHQAFRYGIEDVENVLGVGPLRAQCSSLHRTEMSKWFWWSVLQQWNNWFTPTSTTSSTIGRTFCWKCRKSKTSLDYYHIMATLVSSLTLQGSDITRWNREFKNRCVTSNQDSTRRKIKKEFRSILHIIRQKDVIYTKTKFKEENFYFVLRSLKHTLLLLCAGFHKYG